MTIVTILEVEKIKELPILKIDEELVRNNIFTICRKFRAKSLIFSQIKIMFLTDIVT